MFGNRWHSGILNGLRDIAEYTVTCNVSSITGKNIPCYQDGPPKEIPDKTVT